MSEPLQHLIAGMPIVFGGDRFTLVPPELADAFHPGDRLVVAQNDGALLHIPAADAAVVQVAVDDAVAAFAALNAIGDDQISRFFTAFADRLADPDHFAPIAAANDADVEAARRAGRSTTRLQLSDKMRADMIAGLRGWAEAGSGRDVLLERIDHGRFTVEQRRAGLGVVGFVFEGRPNVFADAAGVLRGGNSVVFRIGSDALGTARAIVEAALAPALRQAGLPDGAVRLVDAPSRAAGWALFSDPRLSLAVARGSGQAVAQLGAVARQTGIPVSLHGTGGAWMVAADSADVDRFAAVVEHSLDRKVCNTLNVCVVLASRAAELIEVVVAAAERAAAARGTAAKFHVTSSAAPYLADRMTRSVTIGRAEGERIEPQAELLALEELGTEWEWEDSPELSLVVVDDLDAAVNLINRYSPRLVASLISDDPAEHASFYAAVDAPFIGDGFTRWVDGQYALSRPELGLSNWEGGRLFGRSAVLSGDSVFTVRTRLLQRDADLHR